MTVFGDIVTARRVRHAMLDTIRLWSPTYLAEVARQEGLAEPLDDFRSFETPSDLERIDVLRPPGIAVVSAGLLGEPQRSRRGLRVVWGIGATVVVSAATRDATNDLAGMYLAAVTALAVQHPTLGGVVQSTEWLDAEFEPLGSEGGATFGANTALFAVAVDRVLDPDGGPRTVPTDPTAIPPEGPLVDSVGITITKER